MAVAPLTTVSIFTFRPAALNRPRCWAIYSAAESATGTAPTTKLCFSTGGADTDPLAVEHPPLSSAMATTAAAAGMARTRYFMSSHRLDTQTGPGRRGGLMDHGRHN